MKQKLLSHDPALWFLGILLTLLLIVSIPATWAMSSMFHSSMYVLLGFVTSVEIGMVSSILILIVLTTLLWRIGLTIFSLAMLGLSFFSNYALGHYVLINTTGLNDIFLEIQQHYANEAALAYGAIVPVIIFGAAHGIVHRVKELKQSNEFLANPDRITEPSASPHYPPAPILAPKTSMPVSSKDGPKIASRTVPVNLKPCDSCGEMLNSGAYRAMKRYGYCKKCKGKTHETQNDTEETASELSNSEAT